MKERITEKEHLHPGLEIFCGPMFSGKSSQLITELRRAPHAGLKGIAFTPAVDDRREKNTINSDDGAQYPAVTVHNSSEILDLVSPEHDIVGIDEGNFFDMGLTDICRELVLRGKRVIVAGLDKDFRGEPFGPMAVLKQEAEDVHSMHAFCNVCHREASFTQRIKIIDGKRIPANYDDPLILVGAESDYEARCRQHHEVPGRPGKNKS
ncbi:MAG: thymidine kinase [Microgenomates group bacterium GW2011_GWC1_39_7b]|nr:MAG: thymidine kinase [Microgenomates group bacterium GW2011_GWC1_39_7b]